MRKNDLLVAQMTCNMLFGPILVTATFSELPHHFKT